MPSPKADLILHPVRMRILMALSRQQMTARELSAALPDVAPATLYRHLNTMTKGGILRVVEEKQVRGTVEKRYALATMSAAHLGGQDVASMSKEDHMHLFTAFVVTLLDDFARYLNSAERVNMATDGVGFHKYPLYLSDNEMMEFGRKLNALLVPLIANEPASGRRRRIMSLTLMPDEEKNE
jgi:DNA-binding transcriptional ArsR family regulator